MCGSTRYFRASTSSKYSFDPTGFGEWRMLQGRASQYCWTSAMDLSVELLTTSAKRCIASRRRPSRLAALRIRAVDSRSGRARDRTLIPLGLNGCAALALQNAVAVRNAQDVMTNFAPNAGEIGLRKTLVLGRAAHVLSAIP